MWRLHMAGSFVRAAGGLVVDQRLLFTRSVPTEDRERAVIRGVCNNTYAGLSLSLSWCCERAHGLVAPRQPCAPPGRASAALAQPTIAPPPPSHPVPPAARHTRPRQPQPTPHRPLCALGASQTSK